MSQVLIYYPNKHEVQPMVEYFTRRGVRVFLIEDLGGIERIHKDHPTFNPDLVVIDLHLPKDEWLVAYRRAARRYPKAGILFATSDPDEGLLMRAKVHGAQFFIRPPFNDDAIRHALRRISISFSTQERLRYRLPDIKMPVRIKIVLPYVLLAILIILGAAYIASRVALESVENRFLSQLVDTALISAEWMVEEEDRMLDALRLAANMEEMAEVVAGGDLSTIRSMILPVAINNQEDIIAVLGDSENHLLSLEHVQGGGLEEYTATTGSLDYLNLPFVRRVYGMEVDDMGDKFSGLIYHGEIPYFYVAGPVFNRDGTPVGVVLVGKSLERLGREMRAETLAHISLYDFDGALLASTLPVEEMEIGLLEAGEIETIMNPEEGQSFVRPLAEEQIDYREIIGPFKVRQDESMGLIGVALPETFLVSTSISTNFQIFVLLVVGMGLVVATGLYISRRITNPLLEVVKASAEITEGNYNINVQVEGNDEVAILAYSFNQMVGGLREGSMYRDLLGRTVSPEVRDQLRATLKAGNLKLEGQDAMATVLMADVKGFTSLSEQEDPTVILKWLNELFAELVPIVVGYSGVVNEFAGDALFAFFGILPQPLHMAESAYLACRAALDMLEALDRVNRARARRGDPMIQMGIGINTGPVTAGGLGAEDRLHYTIIGDTVNATQRIESLAHNLNESAIMISKATALSIWDKQDVFSFVPGGKHLVKGKQERIEVYRLLP